VDPANVPAHGGERVAAALAAHGVRFVFTLCGGHISPILVAAKRRGSASSTRAMRRPRSSPPTRSPG